MRTFIKICGVTRPEEIVWAADAGADAVGFVFAPSRRQVSLEQAKALSSASGKVLQVGVFKDCAARVVNEYARALRLDFVQLHGLVSGKLGAGPFGLIRALTPDLELANDALLKDADYLLLDSRRPGSGRAFPWAEAERLLTALRLAGKHLPPIIIAGGLTAHNVLEALELFRPAGVDVSSGVEVDGVKNRRKINEFVQTVRRWEYGKREVAR